LRIARNGHISTSGLNSDVIIVFLETSTQMVTSDFRPEVEIRPFRACTIKNMQYNLYLWPNCRHFCVLKEIGIEEHDGDVRFSIGCGNMVVSCMRNAYGQIIGTVRSLWT